MASDLRDDQRFEVAHRRQELFAPASVMQTKRAWVIGAGGLGARFCVDACKLGLAVEAADLDIVDLENCGCQPFGPKHLGMAKVDAVADLCRELAGASMVPHRQWVTGGEAVEGYVVDCLDTIEARERVWRNTVLPRSPFVERFLSLRMAGEVGQIWCVNPNSPEDILFYEQNALYPPERALALPCNGKAVIYANALVVALGLTLVKQCIMGQTPLRRIDCDLSATIRFNGVK